MTWDDFLKQLCVECELNREQPETFLVRFADENAKKEDIEIADILKISVDSYKKRMSGVYKKFTKRRYPQIKNIQHKFEPLRSLLKKEFSESPSEQERKRLEIDQLNSLSQSLFSSNDQLGALLAAVKAGRKLQETEAPAEIKMQTVCRLWQALYNIRERNRFHGHGNSVYSVSFSPDGQMKMIASASKDGMVNLWCKDGTLVQTSPEQRGSVYSVSFSPDGKTLAWANSDGTVILWSQDGTGMQTFPGDRNWINSISFSPDGKTLASAGCDGMVKLWSLDSTQVETFREHSFRAMSASFSCDLQIIASANHDNTVTLWRLDGTQEPRSFPVHTGVVYSTSFSPDGEMIALASNDGTVTLWRLDGTREKIIQAHTDVVYSVSFSPNARMIASASRDGIVKLWNIHGEEVGTLQMEQPGHYSLSFSPDGKTIASAASINGIVKFWNIDDGKELQTFQVVHHPSWVTNLTFSPDGQIIASASHDGIVKLWHKNGKELHTFETDCAWVNSINFSRDGKTLAFASADGTVILWNIDLEDLLKRGCNWLQDYLKTNPNVSESDRYLCDGIGTQK